MRVFIWRGAGASVLVCLPPPNPPFSCPAKPYIHSHSISIILHRELLKLCGLFDIMVDDCFKGEKGYGKRNKILG